MTIHHNLQAREEAKTHMITLFTAQVESLQRQATSHELYMFCVCVGVARKLLEVVSSSRKVFMWDEIKMTFLLFNSRVANKCESSWCRMYPAKYRDYLARKLDLGCRRPPAGVKVQPLPGQQR